MFPVHPVLTLDEFDQSRPPHRLGIESLCRQEQNSEVRRGGREDVLVAEGFGAILQRGLQLPDCFVDRVDVQWRVWSGLTIGSAEKC